MNDVGAQRRGVERGSLIVRSIWAVCLVIAGLNHARILMLNGLSWDYGGVGWASALYWSGLTIVDPLAAALLFLRPKAGIVSTIVIIVTNVVHNLAVVVRRSPDGDFLERAAEPFLISQIGFMVFVLATARIAWTVVARDRA